MKKLYVLRHAKSLSDNESMNDHARPISDHGRENAERIGEYLKEQNIHPDLVLCSTALRARMTLEQVQKGMGASLNVAYSDKLYLAPAGEMFSQAQAIDDRYSSALMVGHNPGMHQFCLLLTGRGDARSRKTLELKFPTCALAEFELDVASWREIVPGAGTLHQFLAPKLLPVD